MEGARDLEAVRQLPGRELLESPTAALLPPQARAWEVTSAGEFECV